MKTNRVWCVFLITVMMLLPLVFSSSAYAQNSYFEGVMSVTLGESERLEDAIDALAVDYKSITTLIVKGFIAAEGLDFINSNELPVVVLDMSGATFVGDEIKRMSNLGGLETLRLPRPGEGGYSIAANAFYGSKALSGTLVIPSGVTSIGKRAFCCECLAGIEFEEPKDKLVIKAGAFDGCDDVKSIVVHASKDNKVIIEEGAFVGYASEVQFQPPKTQQPEADGAPSGGTPAKSYSNQSTGASTMPIPVDRYVSEEQAEDQASDEIPMSPLEDPTLGQPEPPAPKAKKKTAAPGVLTQSQDTPKMPEAEVLADEGAPAGQAAPVEQQAHWGQTAPAGQEPIKPMEAEALNEMPEGNVSVNQTMEIEPQPVVSGTVKTQGMPAWGYWLGAGALLAAGVYGTAARLTKMRKRRARRILHSLTYASK